MSAITREASGFAITQQQATKSTEGSNEKNPGRIIENVVDGVVLSPINNLTIQHVAHQRIIIQVQEIPSLQTRFMQGAAVAAGVAAVIVICKVTEIAIGMWRGANLRVAGKL